MNPLLPILDLVITGNNDSIITKGNNGLVIRGNNDIIIYVIKSNDCIIR